MNRLFILGSIKFPRGTAGANYEQYFALSLMELGWKVIILGVGENRKQDFDGAAYKYRNIEYFNARNWKQVKYGMGVSFYKEMAEKYQFSKDDYFVLRDLGWQSINWLIKNFGINHVSYIHFDDLRPSQFKLPYINPQYWTNVYKWNLKFRKIKKAFPISEALEKKEQDEKAALDKEKKMQQAMLQIKKKFGKNAILKGMNLLDGATAKERNEQIGGHKA